MSKEIITKIQINASPAKVWAVLTDFNHYPEWNTFVRSLRGEVKVGNTIHVALPGMNFKPTVLAFEKEKEFRWLGHLWFKGLFDGEHRFVLSDNGDGSTTFVHAEKFHGILLPLFKKMLDGKTKSGFEEMNARLKDRVEKSLL